jgi:membrane-bound lytic murein transglycosylase A
LANCGQKPREPDPIPPELPQGPRWVLQESPVAFLDQLDGPSLPLAIEKQLRWFDAPSNRERQFQIGEQEVSAARLRATLETFLGLWETYEQDPQTLSQEISRQFDIYQLHFDDSNRFLMTGYYAPILEGSLKPNEQFRFPLYRKPEDMLFLAVDDFDERILGRGPSLRFNRLPVRKAGNTILPYYDRAQIDGENALRGRSLELVYLDDYWETFLFHVQGGGFVRLRDGTFAKINYAAQNGHPYRGVGRLLIEQGHLLEEELSLQSIGKYLEANPDQLMPLCFQNPSYVFYSMKRTQDRDLKPDMFPHGSLGFPVTTTRSIAMDKRYFAGGGLFFIQGQQVIEASHRPDQVKGQNVQGFVIDQDTGGAIRGGHFDFFCGAGPKSKALAGKLNDTQAIIYQLVLKELPTN